MQRPTPRGAARWITLLSLLATPVGASTPDSVAAWASWDSARRTGTLPDLVEAADQVREAIDHALSNGDADYEAVMNADGMVLRELRRRWVALRALPERARYEALADSLDHLVSLNPTQRIVDYRDPTFRVEVQPYPALDYTEAVTWSLWLRLDGDVSVTETKIVSHADVSRCKVSLQLIPGNRIRASLGMPDGTVVATQWNRPLELGQWHHVAFLFDRPGGPRLYIDGVPVEARVQEGSYAGEPLVSIPDQILYLGGLDRILPGWLADVRAYDCVLSQEAIRTLSLGGNPEEEPIGWWPLDIGAGACAENRMEPDACGAIGAGVIPGEPGPPVLGDHRSLRFSRARESWTGTLRRLESELSEVTRGIPTGPPAPEAGLADRLDTLRSSSATLIHYRINRRTGHLDAFVVDPSASEPVRRVPLGPWPDIEALIHRLLDLLHQVPASGSESAWKASARELALRLWDPLAIGPTHGVRRVRLRLPHPLQGIPFSALVDPQGQYLVERIAFARMGPGRTPSPSVRSGNVLLAVGNPAYAAYPGFRQEELWNKPPGTPQHRGPGTSACFTPGRLLHGTHVEMRRLGELVDTLPRLEYRLLEWHDAFESRLKEVAGDVQVLHLATHSYALDAECLPEPPVNPFSLLGLQLAGVARARPEDNRAGEDGLLSADELSRLPLEGVDLVCFSGCRTALGPSRGNMPDLLSLTSAAWIAGAGSSLATLWDVDDETQPDHVLAFYAAWLGGTPRDEALRLALLAAREGAAMAFGQTHPRTWSALVLEGM